MAKSIRVGITHGDFNGIGYEVILKSLADEAITELCTPVVFGSSELALRMRRELKAESFNFVPIKRISEIKEGHINVVDVCAQGLEPTPGHPSAEAGKAAVDALQAAADALEEGGIDVIVTAPINKKTVYSDRFPYPGHTEFFADRFGKGGEELMILFSDDLRVGLVTTHKPLREVPDAITRESVGSTIRKMDAALRRDFGFERPKIAVLSLNPHVGDNGLLGTEEQTEIRPAIEDCLADGILAFGPYAADGFFGNGTYREFDGIVAMYHDQGLAPFKALAREYGVNYTAGLPYVRTSPDHGSGYDIAGRNVADATSMRQSIYTAIDILRNRRRHENATANPLRPYQPERPSRSERPRRSEAAASQRNAEVAKQSSEEGSRQPAGEGSK